MNYGTQTDEAYAGLRLIHEGEKTLIHRGTRTSDGAPVVRKSLRARRPSPESRARLSHEYSLLADFESDSVARVLSLDAGANGPVITFADEGRSTLATRLAGGPLPLPEFFDLAQSLVKSLGEVHEHRIVHKDINPSNVLWTPEQKRAQIIDFGSASRFSREYTFGTDVRALEGTLAYLAPEQTGRTNHAIDWRADLYSLGATFYEALSGQPPFQAGDAMGLIHAHLAMQPTPLPRLRREIPEVLSDLVNKLLAKAADDRYQSTRGIAHDLVRIIAAYEDGSVHSLAGLEGVTITDRFEMPSRLYGRDEELKALTAAYHRVLDGRSGIVFIKGGAGTGKSALASELYPVVVQHRGYFVSGKFDRYQRHTPYAPLIQATRLLIRQILAGSNEEVAQWSGRILEAVGKNGALIIDSVPELQSLIGRQPPQAQLSADESRNRFNVLLLRFFQSLGSKQHPLVMFVDDLQWADAGSLELIRRLLAHSDTRGVLIVAAFRDDEVSAAHPLNGLLEGITQDGIWSQVVSPNPLNLQDAVALVSDATKRSPNECTELAGILLGHSGGRPFYLRESLLAAHESGAIRYDPASFAFVWDMSAIRHQAADFDPGPLLTERIGRLPHETRYLLGLASCIGSTFDLPTLAAVEGRPVSVLAREIEPAFEFGLIWSLGSWRFADEPGDPKGSPPTDTGQGMCRFVHDEVQAKAYEQVVEAERTTRHLRVARVLYDRFNQHEGSGNIFELVHQITLALERVTDPEERLRFAALFLEASRRAAKSTAFSSAASFVQVGRSLLGSRAWENHYAAWIDLARVGAEAAAFANNKVMLDELISEVRAHAKDVLDQTEVMSSQISYFVAHSQPEPALAVAREALAPLGVALPASASLAHVAGNLVGTLWAMRRKSADVLETLAEMRDPSALAAMRLLLRTVSPAYIADPNMFPLIVLQMVRLSLRHGLSVESPFGFVTYGILLSAVLGRLDKGMELGRFALKLGARDASRSIEAKLAVSFYVTLDHWRNRLSDSLAPLLKAHHVGLETGDIEYACHGAWYYCNYVTWTGAELSDVAETQRKLIARIDEHGSEFHSICGRIFHQFVQVLMRVDQAGESPRALVGDAFDERTDVDVLVRSRNHTGLFHFHHCRAALNYLLGNFAVAMAHGLAARKFEQSVLGSTNVAQNSFYLALATLHEYPRMRGVMQRLLAKARIRAYRRRLLGWSRQGSINYLHKFEMVEGERFRLRGRGERAMACFDSARAHAREGRFRQDEALATELLGRCQLALGMRVAGQETIREAWTLWQDWGALAKAKRLEAEFPEWLQAALSDEAPARSTHSHHKSSGATDDLAQHLDAISALKASRAMVEEIVLDTLLEKLMRIWMENAGAQSGALMLNIDGVAHQQAFGDVDSDQFVVIDPVPLHTSAANTNIVRVPLRVADYVWRSGETVVLDDAASDARFAEDPLIRDRSPLSVLAAPLEHRGRLVGVIYLENSRTPAAFGEERVNLIQVLAAQAAIAIQNARLYRDLEDQANNLSQLNQSLARFVPTQFLSNLGHNSVMSVRLGENVHREMSVLFSDIRGFTRLVESLEPSAHVDFINEYISYMEPAIVEAGGFVDSYIGDAIMALFNSADDAVHAALVMTENLQLLNGARQRAGRPEIRIGIGISTGPLTLGTIGGPQRIKCGVIGDTVNLAARVESLTPTYGASLLISQYTKDRLSVKTDVTLRQVERVTVKGQSRPVTLFEVLDAAPEKDRQSKLSVLTDWNAGLEAFYSKNFARASECFSRASASCASDLAARRFVSSCWRYLDHGVPEGWDGVVALDHK